MNEQGPGILSVVLNWPAIARRVANGLDFGEGARA